MHKNTPTIVTHMKKGNYFNATSDNIYKTDTTRTLAVATNTTTTAHHPLSVGWWWFCLPDDLPGDIPSSPR